jgi:orotate phosphoribosyltransferase-like protein
LTFANVSPAFYFLGVHVNGCPVANVFIYHSNNSLLIYLNPQAHKRVDEAKVNCPIQQQIQVVVNLFDVNDRVERGDTASSVFGLLQNISASQPALLACCIAV